MREREREHSSCLLDANERKDANTEILLDNGNQKDPRERERNDEEEDDLVLRRG